ncbi:hypothetical protein CEXT_724371 [Caerostris extrusa]|uniref:Ycf15 n=1 Tax=Caerostris extrusa TaxID=172846 RepID=A0AAV4N964_CAEEX|nr:hypothetical protein CEXT_724371 [Caerostris extrusa]
MMMMMLCKNEIYFPQTWNKKGQGRKSRLFRRSSPLGHSQGGWLFRGHSHSSELTIDFSLWQQVCFPITLQGFAFPQLTHESVRNRLPQ